MLNVDFKTKYGKLVIEQGQGENKQRFDIGIYGANCMAAFISRYTDNDGNKVAQVYTFFLDAAHANRIAKGTSNGTLFGYDKVVRIELNLFYKEAKPLLMLLVKHGYNVKCYYKKVKR